MIQTCSLMRSSLIPSSLLTSLQRTLINANNKIFLSLVSIQPYKTLSIPCKVMKLCRSSNTFAVRVGTQSYIVSTSAYTFTERFLSIVARVT